MNYLRFPTYSMFNIEMNLFCVHSRLSCFINTFWKITLGNGHVFNHKNTLDIWNWNYSLVFWNLHKTLARRTTGLAGKECVLWAEKDFFFLLFSLTRSRLNEEQAKIWKGFLLPILGFPMPNNKYLLNECPFE